MRLCCLPETNGAMHRILNELVWHKCPIGKYTGNRDGIKPTEFRNELSDCMEPQKISMSPNRSSIAGNEIHTIKGYNFGTSSNAY